MTLTQIREAHQGKWVLIEYRQLARNLEVVEGDVIAEATTKEEIYKLQMTVGPGKNLAIEYCGDWPTDVAVMFVIAHDLPFTGPIDGLLGMDVLTALQARIDIRTASIEID